MAWYDNIKYWKRGKVIYVLENLHFYRLDTHEKTHKLMDHFGSVSGLCMKTAKIYDGFKPDNPE